MPSPRHTSKLEQTCQRGAFDSCSRAASGLEPGTAPPAPLSARGAVQVERATPVLGSIRRVSGPVVRREHLVEQAEPAPPGAWRPPSRSPAQVRRSIDVLCKVRQAPGLRSASALHEERAPSRRAIAAETRRSPPDVRGSLRDMARPSRITRRPARVEGQGSSIRAQILTVARILLRTPRCAVTTRDRVLPSGSAVRREILVGGCCNRRLPVKRYCLA